jgi:hypothetical protein
MAELNGLDEDQIRRLGHWEAGAMEKHYLSALPRKGMRVMSGFSPREGSYYLKRDCLEPPEILLQQVFPQLDNILLRRQQGQVDQSLSCIGFLQLLKRLRKVVLQDSVFLQDHYPDLFIWKFPLFRSTEYMNFRSELLNAVNVVEDPTETRMEDVMPDMCAAVRNHTQTINADMNIQGTRLTRIENQLERIEILIHSFENKMGSAFRSIGSHFATTHERFLENVAPELGAVIDDIRAELNVAAMPAQTAPRPKFKMKRDDGMTVRELWEEWTIGYPLRVPPIPSIRSLETQGIHWREGSESRFFNRRKLILDQVQFRIDSGMSNDAAIIDVEAMRGGKSLNALSNNINAAINNRFPEKRPSNVGIIFLD